MIDFLRCDATADELIDVVEGNRTYIPCIYVLNKIDQISIEELDIICKIPHTVPISAHHKWNYDGKMFILNLIQLVKHYFLNFICLNFCSFRSSWQNVDISKFGQDLHQTKGKKVTIIEVLVKVLVNKI